MPLAWMGLKASISEFSDPHTASNLLRFFQSTQKKKSNHLLHTQSTEPLPHFSSDQIILSFFLSTRWRWQQQQATATRLLLQKFKSNQEFDFPISSSNQISSTPPLFTSLSLFLSSLYPLATTTSRLFQSSNQTKIFTFPCL